MLVDVFNEYVSHYDIGNDYIKLKYNHSYRVMKLQEKYAKKLGFSKEDIELARVIGLLHDIGRFEQMKVYGCDDDHKTIDHADYSCTQLFEKGEIKKFVSNEEWYPVIEFAIRNHNKRVLEENKDERAMMHARLIRDTDKIDIIFLAGKLEELPVEAVDAPVSEEVKKEFYKHGQISNKLIQNLNDYHVIRYGFVYDINNAICLKELIRNIGYYAEHQKGNDDLMEAYQEAKKYTKERLKNEGIR